MKNKFIVILFLILFFMTNGVAQTLKEVVRGTLIDNPDIQSLRINTKAYRLYVDEEEGKQYPRLDLDSYFEDLQADKDGETTNKSGTNTQLSLEQTLFDGWLTPARIDESKFNYNSTKLKNISTIENVVLETVNAYLDVVKNHELILLSRNNLYVHEQYLNVAMKSEVVSGDTLDRMQVESKISSVKAKFSEVKRDNLEARAALEKLYGKELNSDYCRPIVKENEYEDLEALISKALLVNYSVLDEMQKIQKQRAIVKQEKSRFYPTITAKLLHEIDDGVDAKNIKKTEDSFRINLSYNIFNANQDKNIHQRERLFLQEAQKSLDNVVKQVIEEITINHTRYQTSKKRINYLKNYLDKNKDILLVYLEQFQGGTRSFIDILNHEAELFRAKTDLIEEQFLFTSSYYELNNLLSNLSNSILHSKKQMCQEIVVDIEHRDIDTDETEEDADLVALLSEEEGDETLLEEEPKDDKQEKVQSILNRILSEIYNPNAVNENIDISKISYTKDKIIDTSKQDSPEESEQLEKIIKQKQAKEEQQLRQERAKLKQQIKVEAEKLAQKSLPQIAQEKKNSNAIINPEEEQLKQMDLTLKERIKLETPVAIKNQKDQNVIQTDANTIKTKEAVAKHSMKEMPQSSVEDQEGLKDIQKKSKKELSLKKNKKKTKTLSNEVTQNKKSEKYTIAISTLAQKRSVASFRKQYNLSEDIFIYQSEFQGKDYYKVLYGLYDSFKQAQEVSKTLPKGFQKYGLFVNRVSKHQKLFRKYNHKSIQTGTHEVVETKKRDSKLTRIKSQTSLEKENRLKKEFKSEKSKRYTIAILTLSSHKKPSFIKKQYNLKKNIIIYKSMYKGTDYYKVLYGLYDSASEAKKDMKSLDKRLRSNGVFVNKISKHQKLFKKYNSIGK